MPNLGRPGADVFVPADDDEPSRRYRRDPVGVLDSGRTLGDQWVPDVDRVLTSRSQRLSDAESTLIYVEPQTLGVRRHIRPERVVRLPRDATRTGEQPR